MVAARLPRPSRWARPGPALAVLALWAAPAAGEPRDSLSVSLGRMTDNTWQDVLMETGSVTARDAWAVGVAAAREWPLGRAGFVGVEAQAHLHFGEQGYLELAAPVYLRSVRPESVWLPALAYGLGLSWTSAEPRVEIDRRGESQRLLAYWFIELEFAARRPVRPFLRLHHRSDAFGLFEADTGSNLVELGLRRDF